MNTAVLPAAGIGGMIAGPILWAIKLKWGVEPPDDIAADIASLLSLAIGGITHWLTKEPKR